MNAIALNKINHRRIENYARLTGQPVSAILEEAITFWMDAIGDVNLEELQQRKMETQSEKKAQDFLKRLRHGKGASSHNLLTFPLDSDKA